MKRAWHIFFILVIAIALPGCATVSTSGDYTLQQGETLRGNLVITSGNARLEEASRVTGDVFMTSGNLEVDGEVDGNILVTSGNVSLGPKALVKGNITATSGNINQVQGAQVRGEISSNQSTFTIGGGFIARLLSLACILPLLLCGALIFLLVLLTRRKPAAVTENQVAADTSTEKLKQLKQMFDEGLITETEYEAKKADILSDL